MLWQLRNRRYCNSWGLDHNEWVFEPHPLPDKSCREVIKNLKRSLQAMVPMLEDFSWRAGAYVDTPQRPITLGGHVHIDLPKATRSQINALNCFTRTLLHLNILPELENRARRDRGDYGRYGDVRTEHGHFEYRTFPSWLYSQRVAMLCLTGSKLAVVKPDTLLTLFPSPLEEPHLRSKGALKSWFEFFKGDDDVDYILEKKFFEGKLEAMPDRDLKEAWRLSDELEVSEKIISEELAKGTERERTATATIREMGAAQAQTWAGMISSLQASSYAPRWSEAIRPDDTY